MANIFSVNEGSSLKTLGIVIEPIDRTTQRVKIRIPSIHGPVNKPSDNSYWVSDEDLPDALINFPLGLDHGDYQIKVGTVVYVEFIADDFSYPIVTGWAGGVKLSETIITNSTKEWSGGTSAGYSTGSPQLGNYFTIKEGNPGPETSNGFILPFDTTCVNWPFKPYNPFGTGSTMHYGIDLGSTTGSGGTPVYNIKSGTIYTIFRSPNDPGTGNAVYIDSTDNDGAPIRIKYMHFDRFSEIVDNGSAGMTVNQGDLIGYIGTTGPSTGPHLHLGIYYPEKGMHRDPGVVMGVPSWVSGIEWA